MEQARVDVSGAGKIAAPGKMRGNSGMVTFVK